MIVAGVGAAVNGVPHDAQNLDPTALKAPHFGHSTPPAILDGVEAVVVR